jgi:polysaccharide transporter, PST family
LFNKNNILILDRILSIIISVTTMSIATRLIGLDDFGLWIATMSFVGFFSIFTTLGFEPMLVKRISASPDGIAEVFYGVLSRIGGTFFSVILLLLTFFIFRAPIEIYWAFPILLSRLFNAINSFDQFYQAQQDFATGARIRIESGLMFVVFLSLGLFLNQSVVVVISAYVFLAFYEMFCYLRLEKVRRYFNNKVLFGIISFDRYKDFLRSVTPLFISSTLIIASLNFDKIIGSYNFSLIDLGLYGLAFAISQSLVAVFGAVNNLYFNKIIVLKKYFILKSYVKAFIYILACIFITYVFISFFGEYILSFIFGEGFGGSLTVLKIFIIGIVPTLMTQINDAYLVTHDCQKYIMYRTIGYLLALVSLSPFFIIVFDYVGMAILIVFLRYVVFIFGFMKVINFKGSK